MMSGLKSIWRWLSGNRANQASPPVPPAKCCPDCLASEGRSLSDRLSHLVQFHLDVEERWLLKLLMSNYHLNDLCVILGAGPDTVRYRVTSLRAKILILLNQQQAQECVKRSFHRLLSGPWF